MIKSWNVENVETAQRDVSIMLSFLLPICTVYQCLHLLRNTDSRFYGESAFGRLKKRTLPCSPKLTKLAVTSSWYFRSTTAEHFKAM